LCDVKKHAATLAISYVYYYLSIILDNAENCEITLEEILSFFTGSEYPPPLGFETVPSVQFSSYIEYPTASTCVLEITLPTKYHDSPKDFNAKMIYALKNHGGFGLL